MRIKYLFCSLCCILFLRSTAQYSYSDNVVSIVNIQATLTLTIANNTGTAFSINNSTGKYTASNFNTVSIKSNTPWNLYIASATAFFAASGSGASSNMPASVISLGKSGQSASVQLSTSPRLLASGNRGQPSNSGNTFNMDLTANPGYDYGPGIYTITISYTLTAQ